MPVNVAPPVLAKVSRPSAALIGRPSLVAEVEAAGMPLVWIAAPAGSGKTSLALEYAQGVGCPVGWLRLDEADVDLGGFLHYLEQAIVSADIAPGWRMPPIAREHLPAPQGYLRLFARSLAAAMVQGACIVLDDAQKCQEAPFFRHFLEMLAEELPAATRVLILSRAAPPDGCARLLAHGALRVFDAEALAFSREETEKLLSTLGLADAAKVCDTVLDYTHGWAAGIALAASLLRRRPDAAIKLDDMSHVVASYLATEVLSTLSEAERDTLLSVCLLPYFRTSWAVALTGKDEAGETLARLAAQGALIYQYPGRQFSFHPLFQRFLRDWSRQRVAEARRSEWVECGVRLLEDDGNPDAAIELALEYGLAARAAVIIAASAPTMLAEARLQTLARWIELLPESLRSPWHHFWHGVGTTVTDTAIARKSLLAACDGFAATGEWQHRFMALALIVVSYSFNGAASEPLKAMLARFTDAERDYERLTDPEPRAHMTLGMYSGLSTTDPGHPDLDLWEERTVACLADQVSLGIKARLAVWMSIHCFFTGRYRRISSLRTTFESLVEVGALPSYTRYLTYFLFLFDKLVCGDHEALAATYAESRQVSEATGFRSLDGHFALQFADSLLLQGRLDEARAVLAKVAAATPATYFNLLGHLHIVQSCAAARSGDAVAARTFSAQVREAGRNMGSVPYELWGRAGECIAAALLGLPGLAEEVAELRRLGGEARFPSVLIHADCLDAWRLLQAGDEEGAIVPLGRGLAALGEESEGFLWGAVPQILQPLCELALRRGIEPDAAKSVVRAYRLPPPAEAPADWPWPLAVRCFGGFELRVEGKPLPSRGKSKHRQIDLLKLVAAHAPAALPVAKIAEYLWPDSDGDAARHALETTLSRLRATMGHDAFHFEHGCLALDPSICRADTAILEQRLSRLEAGEGDILAEAKAVLEVFRGELLAGESAPWLLLRRQYWTGRIARILGGAARSLAGADAPAAIRLLEQALEADPYSEPLTAILMAVCLDAGRSAEGLAAYRRYQHLACTVLGTPLGAEIQSLARRLHTSP